MLKQISMFAVALVTCWVGSYIEAKHPRLLLTAEDVETITKSIHESPSFTQSLNETRSRVDAYFATPPDVPEPTDAGGGYSHEQHKSNGIAIREAGIVFQLTGEERYAKYAEMLFTEYAEMYPGLGEHPMKKEQTPGRLFWQNLNESVWLVHAIQGYDAIVSTLDSAAREFIERRLLRRMARFLSEESPGTFDRIHNHGTWAVAAVGMTGYVLNDQSYIEKALYGLKKDGSAGFLKQLDLLVSPDGFYAEGPYYQRYALMPMVVFAKSIENNNPELEIFSYRDGLILKTILACVELSYGGLFFPINDAIKDKGLDTVELRYGMSIAYALTGDASLLSVMEKQRSYVLTGDGFKAALATDQEETQPYVHQSVLFRDGPQGNQGGLAVLRSESADSQQALVLKATAQGLGHGHFDKLHWLFFDNGSEIVTDYGAARFLNIEAKNGGRYLPENLTWAKQTIAHNTVVVDGKSHFDAELSVAEQFHPEVQYFSDDGSIQVVAATIANAYDDVEINRTLVLLDSVVTDGPLVLDVLTANGSESHQFDLPLHFNGQVIASNVSLEARTESLRPLGQENGYQHLWLRAEAQVDQEDMFSMTWLKDDRFYTYTTQAGTPSQVFLAELGANDPQMNLRREQSVILRTNGSSRVTFVSTLEAHGEYNAAEEFTIGSEGSIKSVEVYSGDTQDMIRLEFKANDTVAWLALSYDSSPDQEHRILVDQVRTFEWTGFYGWFEDTANP